MRVIQGRLDGKVCLITGTGGAIGSASALAFAREGALIVGCDLDAASADATAERVRAAGGNMVSLAPCDLSVPKDCARLVDLALSHHGRIDVLFNNAGRPTYGAIDSPDDTHWYATIQHELHLVYLLTKAAWPALSVRGGAIVNMASVAGWTGLPALDGLAHSTVKAGILAMTRHLAMEGRHHDIRVNSISPGVIGTPSALRRAEDPAWDAAMRGKIMRGRYGTPEEIAAVALFLASDESGFVNGADIRADGGMSAW